MTNIYEFIRILAYLLGAFGTLNLGVYKREYFIALSAISVQFFLRSILIFLQIINPQDYYFINNLVSTPCTAIMVILVYYNIFRLRKI